MRTRWWMIVALAGSVAGLVYLAAPDAVRWWLWPLFPLGSAVATACALRCHTLKHSGPTWVLAAALAVIGVGDVVRVTGGPVDVSSLCFLLGYVGLAASALWVTRLRLPEGDRAGGIDSMIVMVAIAAVLWDVISAPALNDARTQSEVVSLVAFPVLQAWVMASMIRIIFAGAGRLFTAWALVLASAAALAANVLMITAGGDLINPPSQALWAFTYVAVAAGMLHPHLSLLAQPGVERHIGVSYVRLGILGVALAAVPAVMLRTWNVSTQGPPIAIVAATACVVLVLWRIGLLLSEREASLRQLRASWTELDRRARRESALARMSEGAVGSWTLDELTTHTVAAVSSVVEAADVRVHLGDDLPDHDVSTHCYPAATVDGTYGCLLLELPEGTGLDEGEEGFVRAAANVLASAVHRRRSEAEARHRAFHDALTGLPNRMLLMDRLQHALLRAGRQGTTVTLLFIDLDGFKAVNDTLGHLAGDEALIEVTRRLDTCIRESDTLARLAGDEFVVACEAVPQEDAVAIASRIVEVISEPFVLMGGVPAVLGASVGIATVAGDDKAESLLHAADAAMYDAKRAGGARVAVAVGQPADAPTAVR